MPKTLKAAGKIKNICELSGLVLGVDIEVWLHKGMQTADAAVLHCQEPPVPIPNGVAIVGALNRRLHENGIEPVYVFGGSKHTGKAPVDAKRAEDVKKAQKELDIALLESVPEEATAAKAHHARLNQLRKKASTVREDYLALVIQDLKDKKETVLVAPGEAEWQLAYLEKAGLTDGTITVDSDLFPLDPLGEGIIVFDLDSNGQCCVVCREDAHKCEDLGGGQWDAETVALYAALSGCDYVPRVYGQGKVAARSLTRDCIASKTARHDVLSNIENTKKYGSQDGGVACDGYAELVYRAIAIFNYAPVFLYTNIEAVDFDDFEPAYVEIKLGSLTPLPEGTTEDEWTKMLGFDPQRLIACVSPTISLKDLYYGRIWCRTGQPFRLLPPATSNGTVVPHGSVIDFTKQPVATHPTDRLAVWLWARNLPAKSTQTRKDIIDSVSRVRAMGDAAPPIQPITHVIGSGRYMSLETLTSDGPLLWVTDTTKVLEKMRALEEVSMQRVGSLLGPRSHNGVRKRALARFLSGSINLSTLKYTELHERATGKVVTCFEMVVSPSMKMKDYRLMMIFRDQKFLGSPSSRCGCPDGNLFCSHMLAFWIVIYLFQQFHALSFDDFFRLFPEPIQSLHSVPIPWSYICIVGTNGECQLSAAAVDLFQDNSGGKDHDVHSDTEPCTDDEDQGTDILAQAAEYIDKCLLEEKSVERARPVKRAKIIEYTKMEMQKRSGELPFAEQREKDELHERLHKLYESGELEKTALAFYLFVNAAKRQERLRMPAPVEPPHD